MTRTLPLRRSLILGAALALGALNSGVARADGEAPLAEALFRSARALIAAGNYAEACPKLAESQRLDPKLGTLMNLALCHAKEGKTASAWAEYTRAAELASRAGQGERERVARKSASELEAQLSNLTVRSQGTDPITVTVDGVTLGAATLGTPIPIDPGVHQVVATGEGRKPYTQSVTVTTGAPPQTVTIPPLEKGAAPVALAAAPPAPSAGGQAASEPYGHPVLGYALLAGGAVAIVTGSVFGGLAFSKKSAAEGQCNAQYCTQAGLDDISMMKTSEAISTIGIGVGIAAAGAGVYFVLRSGKRPVPPADAPPAASVPPPSARLDPLVGPGLGGLALSGRF